MNTMQLDSISYPVKILKYGSFTGNVCKNIHTSVISSGTYSMREFEGVIFRNQRYVRSDSDNVDTRYLVIQDSNDVELYVTITSESVVICHQMPKLLLVALLGS